jgi:hypothetical protein
MFDVGEMLIVMFSKYACLNIKASASRNVVNTITFPFVLLSVKALWMLEWKNNNQHVWIFLSGCHEQCFIEYVEVLNMGRGDTNYLSSHFSLSPYEPGYLIWYSNGLQAGWPSSVSEQGQEIFLYCTASRLALETHPASYSVGTVAKAAGVWRWHTSP